MKEPKVSIIMNCLNGSEYLKEALDSVMMQTYKNWEVIFWDNASTDDSASIAKSYGEKINYFCSDSTIKISIARERAFNEASGEYIAILDVDDIWFPQKIRTQYLEKYYRLNNAIYIADTSSCSKTKTFFIKENSYAYEMDNIYSVDIDNEIDLKIFEYHI